MVFSPVHGSIYGCSVVVFLVGASSFENDVAWKSVFNSEAELRLVQHVLLWFEVHLDRAWQVLALKLVLGHRWADQAFWCLSQRLRFSLEGALSTNNS